MASFDGVIEAVHFAPDGQVAWVRAYERRGSAFSDSVIISRQELVEKLRQGKRFVIGKRLRDLGGTFDTSISLRLRRQKDGDILVTDRLPHEQDCVEGVPLI